MNLSIHMYILISISASYVTYNINYYYVMGYLRTFFQLIYTHLSHWEVAITPYPSAVTLLYPSSDFGFDLLILLVFDSILTSSLATQTRPNRSNNTVKSKSISYKSALELSCNKSNYPVI